MPTTTYAGSRLTTCRGVSKLVSSYFEPAAKAYTAPLVRSLAVRQSRHLSLDNVIGSPLANLNLPSCKASACCQINSISYPTQTSASINHSVLLQTQNGMIHDSLPCFLRKLHMGPSKGSTLPQQAAVNGEWNPISHHH